jgi:hypothetical protein
MNALTTKEGKDRVNKNKRMFTSISQLKVNASNKKQEWGEIICL